MPGILRVIAHNVKGPAATVRWPGSVPAPASAAECVRGSLGGKE